MSTALALVENEVLDPEPTLDALASTANHEHECVQHAGRTMIQHAIVAGEALLAARAQCGEGEWRPWLDHNFRAGSSTATAYMRIAHYKEQICAEGLDQINQANAYLRGLSGPHGPASRTGKTRFYPEETRAEAQRLHAAGLNYSEIARLLGVTKSTAHVWCDPAYAEHHRKLLARAQRERARKRQVAKERARSEAIKRAVCKAGAATAEAWAMAERFQDVIAQAHDETQDSEARAALARAGEHYRKMRDEIVRALGVQ